MEEIWKTGEFSNFFNFRVVAPLIVETERNLEDSKMVETANF